MVNFLKHSRSRRLNDQRPAATTKVSSGVGSAFKPVSRDLVDRDLVGDATQGAALRRRSEPAGFEKGRGLRVGNDTLRRQDRARLGESLNACGDVHGRPEIIL